MSSSALPPLRVGTLFAGRYAIQLEVASGLNSEVHFARQRDNGRLVAIKRLKIVEEDNVQQIRSFRGECLVVSSLRHRNTVQLHDYGYHHGIPYLVLEAVVGTTLAHEIAENGPVSPERAQRILLQVVDSLGEAHAYGVLHRDIKPSNIMLTAHPLEEDFVRVLDFGIATFHTQWTEEAVQIAGTPLYVAPELTRNEPATPAADLYSLGILAFELVVGSPPFRGGSALATMMKHTSEPLPRLPPHVFRSPVGEFIRSATEKDVLNRLSDVETARLVLLGERQYSTLPPPQVVRCSQIPHTPRVPTKPVPSNPVAVPRTEGERHLRAALVEALRATTPSVVLVTGPRGIGVTELTKEVLRTTEFASKPRLIEARCGHGGPIPCDPLFEAFRSSGVPDDEMTVDTGHPSGEQPVTSVQVRSASRTMWALAVGAPTILFLDDLHLAEEDTIRCLEMWLHRALEKPQSLVILGTVSTLDPSTSREFDRFVSLLLTKWSRLVWTVSLGPLEPNALEETLRRRFSKESAVVEAIQALLAGRPDFLFQLFHHFTQDRMSRISVPPTSGVVGAKGPELRLPLSFRDLLMRRLSSAQSESPALYAAIECLAVLGPSTIGELEALIERTPQENKPPPDGQTSESVQIGVARRLLRTQQLQGEPTVEIASEELRLVVEQRLRDFGSWGSLNLSAAEALQHLYGDELVALSRVSSHLLETEDVHSAFRSLLEASKLAKEQGAENLAAQYLDRAHLKAQSVALPTERHVEFLAVLAEAKMAVGVDGAARDLHREAIEGFDALGPCETGLRARMSYARLLYESPDVDQARAQLQAALREAVEIERFDFEAEIAFRLGRLEARAGNLEAAAGMLHHSVAVCQSLQKDPVCTVRINIALGDIAAASGDLAKASELIHGATTEVRSLDQGLLLAECLRARSRVSLRLGSPTEAEKDLVEAMAILERESDTLGLSRLLLERAVVRFQLGDYRGAVRFSRQAKHASSGLRSADGEAAAGAFLIRSLFQSQRHDEVIEEATEVLRVNELAGSPVDRASCLHFLCRSHLRNGSGECAVRAARLLQELVEKHQLVALRAPALIDLSESLLVSGLATECAKVARKALAVSNDSGDRKSAADATAVLEKADRAHSRE